MSDWDKRLAEQVQRKFKNVQPVLVKLDAALADQELPLCGDILYVNRVSSRLAAATVKLGSRKAEALELKLHKKIKAVFTQFYVTAAAQAGEWIELLVGIDFDIDDVIEPELVMQPALVITHASADTNVAGAAHGCVRAFLKADAANTGKVWFDIGTAAVQGSCGSLDAGEVFPLDINNTNLINANFEVGGEKLFVYYSV